MNYANDGKIITFTDLNAWKEAHFLVLSIYEITKNFPKDELFGLTSQMRRCAVSITSNIAEGFGRQSFKEKLRFYFIAIASLTELQNQLIITKDIKYISISQFNNLYNKSIKSHKILNGLIKATKTHI